VQPVKDCIREDWRVALEAVIAGDGGLGPDSGPCWIPRARVEETTAPAVVEELLEQGWLELWRGIEGGPALTLTPYAANQLGVELIEVGMDETPVWAYQGDVDPYRPIRVRRNVHERPLPYPELLIDPAPPVADLVVDGWSGQPLRLWGRTISRDYRLKAG
jgi:hypothetical protein